PPGPGTLTTTNPLLDVSSLPRFADIQVAHIRPAVEAVLSDAARRVAELERLRDDATWDDFVAPLEDIEDRIERVWAPVSHLNAVMDSEGLRRVHDECLELLTAFYTDLGQNEGLYRGFVAVSRGDDFAAFDDARRKTVDNALRDFRLGGVALKGDARRRFKAVSEQLSTLCNRF